MKEYSTPVLSLIFLSETGIMASDENETSVHNIENLFRMTL